jgi:hypothetical protein
LLLEAVVGADEVACAGRPKLIHSLLLVRGEASEWGLPLAILIREVDYLSGVTHFFSFFGYWTFLYVLS